MPRRASQKAGPRGADTRGIPEKPFFKIGEAAKICAVKPYVLRYWETEFRAIKPQKTKSGQRVYKRTDIDLLLQIRELLYQRCYTIEGARTFLRQQGHDEAEPPPVPPPPIDREGIAKIKQGIIDLMAMLDE